MTFKRLIAFLLISATLLFVFGSAESKQPVDGRTDFEQAFEREKDVEGFKQPR